MMPHRDLQASLPSAPSGPYDVDVVVVGGGPAGLAAATRVRWVKGYHALPSSVCVVESGAPGGLLGWGSCVLTGPGWAYQGPALAKTLMTDIERLRIPVVNGLVTRLSRQGPLLRVGLQDGRSVRCLAVILAAGFRPLANEAQYYLRGVRVTFKGYDHFPALVAESARDAGGRGLVVVGNHKTAHMRPLLKSVAAMAGGITEVNSPQRLISVDGQATVEAVWTRRPGEAPQRLACGAVLMDYNAFELAPELSVVGCVPHRDERGFIRVNSRMETSEPGVFAAGDVTGRYASTLMALGDGVCAGFSAYAYAFVRKVGCAPRLFAYSATDRPVPETPRDLPPIPQTAFPVSLGDAPAWMDGQRDISRLEETLSRSRADILTTLQDAIARRAATWHRLGGSGSGIG